MILFYTCVLKRMKTKKKKKQQKKKTERTTHNIKTVYDLQKLNDIFLCAFVMALIFISTS